MTDNRTVTGLVIDVERLGLTVWGNPMYKVMLSTPTRGFAGRTSFRISNDASLNGIIENMEFRKVPHVFALTRAGRISHCVGAAE